MRYSLRRLKVFSVTDGVEKKLLRLPKRFVLPCQIY